MLNPVTDKSRARRPAVAGLFYPEDGRALRALVADLLDRAPPGPADRPAPKALIVPHAGYAYSGPVAATAYRWLRDSGLAVRTVVLLGPSHRVPMRGLAVPSCDVLDTPLGEIPVDNEGRRKLRECGLAGVSDAPHAQEHSIEVQLPFLQAVLGDFSVLPIAFGIAPTAQIAGALETVWNGPSTLVVVSSDLSHYHTYREARLLDDAATRAILERRGELGDTQACGAAGINGLMEVARRKGLAVCLLDQRNSGDTAGDRSRVVGYGSYALHAA